MKKALEGEEKGVRINEKPVNNIRYADDTVLIAETLEDLQCILNKVVAASEENGLTLNVKKTKFMIISKKQQVNGNIFMITSLNEYINIIIWE